MTLDQLRYFTAVASYQHVGRAANAVAISPSVISSAISALEQELQCELFRRNGRNIELTSDGARLLERGKTILSSIDNLKNDMKHQPETLSGKYRLGASHFLASRLLLNGWNRLQKKHPGLVADIYSMNTAHAIADVLSARLDLAVCFSPLKHPDLHDTIIHRGDLVVVVRKGHPVLKKTAREQLKFLAQTPATIHKAAQGVDICETHSIFDKLGFQPKINLFWDSDDIAVQRLQMSDAWSFVPDIVAESNKPNLQIMVLPRSAGMASYHISSLVYRDRSHDRVLTELGRFLST